MMKPCFNHPQRRNMRGETRNKWFMLCITLHPVTVTTRIIFCSRGSVGGGVDRSKVYVFTVYVCKRACRVPSKGPLLDTLSLRSQPQNDQKPWPYRPPSPPSSWSWYLRGSRWRFGGSFYVGFFFLGEFIQLHPPPQKKKKQVEFKCSFLATSCFLLKQKATKKRCHKGNKLKLLFASHQLFEATTTSSNNVLPITGSWRGNIHNQPTNKINNKQPPSNPTSNIINTNVQTISNLYNFIYHPPIFCIASFQNSLLKKQPLFLICLPNKKHRPNKKNAPTVERLQHLVSQPTPNPVVWRYQRSPFTRRELVGERLDVSYPWKWGESGG